MMKKSAPFFIFFVLLVTDIFAQVTDTFASTRTFATYYGFKDGKVTEDSDNEYYWEVSVEDEVRFGAYEEVLNTIDTAKEWFLTMACGTSQIKVTDISMATKIEAVLPNDDMRKKGLKAGMLVYQDVLIAKFLGDTNMLSKYEGWLKFVCDKNGVKRAEIEKYYRDNIRGFIAEIVSEEFNKISFSVRVNSSTSYSCILTRNAQNQYVLSYESYFGTDTKSMRTLTITSLETLPSTLSRNGDFSTAVIDTISAQAALIPAVAYPASVQNDAVNVITAFCLNPNQTTFHALGVQYRKLLLNDAEKGRAAAYSFGGAVAQINIVLYDRMLAR